MKEIGVCKVVEKTFNALTESLNKDVAKRKKHYDPNIQQGNRKKKRLDRAIYRVSTCPTVSTEPTCRACIADKQCATSWPSLSLPLFGPQHLSTQFVPPFSSTRR